MSEPTKVLSLRIPESLATSVADIAYADGLSVSRCIREAIEDHIARRRSAPDFEERVKKRFRNRMEEDRARLERLSS